MKLSEKKLIIAKPQGQSKDQLLQYIEKNVLLQLEPDETPVRFVITHSDEHGYHCELGVLSRLPGGFKLPKDVIFNFSKRKFESSDQFNIAFLIPTGIGAEIGGHSGDGGAVARLFATVCDNLITHPNVVNAADINELPENALYVEGSVITRLLMGTIALQKVRSNRIMLVIDKHEDKFFYEAAINSASAARAAFGLNCPIVVTVDKKVLMHAFYSTSGRAIGRIDYLEYLCEILEEYKSQYDAVALSSLIDVPLSFHSDYFREDHGDMVNPWGGVEAMLTHAVSLLFNIPSAHSPMMSSKEELNLDVGIVDPRKSAEAVSTTYLHCILKGLHRSPKIIENEHINNPALLTVSNISCLVIPYGCLGLPTLAALQQGIPVIAVRENKNRMQNKLEDLGFSPGQLFVVDNYFEAIGLVSALKAGVAPDTVRRPISKTNVVVSKNKGLIESIDSQTFFDKRSPNRNRLANNNDAEENLL